MSFSATVVVNDAALHEAGSTALTYAFDTATTMDLQHYVASLYGLPGNYQPEVKWKTEDLEGKPLIVTMTPITNLQQGEKYFVFMDSNAAKDLQGTTAPFDNEDQGHTHHTSSFVSYSSNGIHSLCLIGEERDKNMETFNTNGHLHTTEQLLFMNPQAHLSTQTNNNSSLISRHILPVPLARGKNLQMNVYLGRLYAANQGFMDDTFQNMVPSGETMYQSINLIKFITQPVTIAALVVLLDETMFSFDDLLPTFARKYAKKAIMDIITEAYKDSEIPRNAVDPLAEMFRKITGNEYFATLSTNGTQSPSVLAVKKRKARHAARNGEAPRQKKQMLTMAPTTTEDIEQLVLALSEAHSSDELDTIVSNTSQLRCRWIGELEQDDSKKFRKAQVTASTFPCFKRNHALLHHDFKYTMEYIKKLPVLDLTSTLRRYASAIVSLGKKKEITPLNGYQGIEENMLEVSKLLIMLVPIYCKQNQNSKPDRLFVETKGLKSVTEMADVREQIRQKAAMMLVHTTDQGCKYYVAIDDLIFKINGDSADALQTIVQLHYIYGLHYAQELLNFHVVLEHLAGLDIQGMPTHRANLYFDILSHASQSSSKALLNETMHDTQNVNHG